jgi:hypothetical protein
VRARDAEGRSCLLVLPSDAPSTRQEAAAAAAALHRLLRDPGSAAAWAAAWRQQLLMGSSSSALLGLTAGCSAPQQYQQQLRRQQAGTACGAAMASGGTVAGPAWLASAAAAGGAAAGAPSGSAEGLVHAVRSTSGFLNAEGHSSAGSLPLGQLGNPAGGSVFAHASPAMHMSLQVPASGAAWQQLGTAATAAPAPLANRPMGAEGGTTGGTAGGGQDPAWDTFCSSSLAAGLAVCMAEAVRQVEVGCAERGRLLAQIWNCYSGEWAAGTADKFQATHTVAARSPAGWDL